MRISDWSSDVCSSDLRLLSLRRRELASLQHAQGYRILARIFPGMGRDQSHFLRPKDVEETAEREYPPNRHVKVVQPRNMTGWIGTDFHPLHASFLPCQTPLW